MATGTPNYAIAPNGGTPAILQIGDASRVNPTSYQTILTAGASGTRIERITLQSAGGTVSSVVRFFLYDGANFHLYTDVAIPGTTPQAGASGWSTSLQAFGRPDIMPLLVKTGWSLVATVNDSQIVAVANPISICAVQTTGGAGVLNMNGANVTAKSNAAIAALANPGTGIPFTMTATPYVFATPAMVTLTSSSNDSATLFKVAGIDPTGAVATETITGPNNTTVYGVNVYRTILQVVAGGSTVGNLSVGYSPIADGAIFVTEGNVIIASGKNESGVTFTISGSGSNGVALTENLVGPNNSVVTSVNKYTAVYSVSAGGAVSNNTSVGNAPIFGGVSVAAITADY